MSFFSKSIISFLRDLHIRYLEDWSWFNSLYFSVITLPIINIGDFSPKTNFKKIFTIDYIIVGTSLILSFENQLFFSYKKQYLRYKLQT
ncbi:MAG: hypothetical protein CMC89_02370 [Flavobacteriaceae bacterium]|nr:hypothetical protein [Flavobacteriaceae bacterium]